MFYYYFCIVNIIFSFIVGNFKIILDIITALATAILAYCAIVSLPKVRTWEKQLLGTQFEIARKLLRSTLRVKYSISYVRNPWIPWRETSDALKETNLGEKDSMQAVYQIRWKKILESLSNLDADSLDAEVLWGKIINDIQKPLKDCISELNASLWQYLNNQDLKGEKLDKVRNVIYESRGGELEDDFSKKINNAVLKIEEFLKPFLKI